MDKETPPSATAKHFDDTLFPDGLLWHFTKPECLVSILKNGIRATHSAFLSDRLDGSLRNRCQRLYSDLMAAKASFKGDSGRVENAKEQFRKILNLDAAFPSFIACFVANPDFEAMWERYGLDGGIAIGIREQFVFQKRRKTDEENVLVKFCNYHNWDSLLDAVRRTEIRVQGELKSCSTLEDVDKLCRKEIPAINEQATNLLFAKRRIFEFEHEVRLAWILLGLNDNPQAGPGNEVDAKCDPTAKYNPKLSQENGKLFVHIPFGKQPKDWVARIIVGPYGDVDRHVASALTIARLFGISQEQVEMYTPPYLN